MRFLLIPLVLILLVWVLIKFYKSRRVDKFLDSVVTKPTPNSAEALAQEVDRIKEEEERTKRAIETRKEEIAREHDSLSKLTKNTK